MLRVNLWQKLFRVGFEGNTVQRAQKNQETAYLANVGNADRKGRRSLGRRRSLSAVRRRW